MINLPIQGSQSSFAAISDISVSHLSFSRYLSSCSPQPLTFLLIWKTIIKISGVTVWFPKQQFSALLKMLCLCVCVNIQGDTSPYGQECLLFFDASPALNWDLLPVATLLCMLTSHIVWNPVASLSPISSPLSLLISHLSPSLHLSAPFLPPSPAHREDCVWGPEAEEGSPVAGPRWEDPTSAWACGATAQTHTVPGEPWVNTHPYAPAHTDRVTYIFLFPNQPPLLLFWPYLLPLFISSGPASFPLSTDVFEDDISSCSSSSPTEQHGVHQSPAFSSLPGVSGDQLLSDFSAAGPPRNQVKKWHWDLLLIKTHVLHVW